jgi:hypothetical protein
MITCRYQDSREDVHRLLSCYKRTDGQRARRHVFASVCCESAVNHCSCQDEHGNQWRLQTSKDACGILRRLFEAGHALSFLWQNSLTEKAIGRPDMRVKHCAYGHSVATLLSPRGVTTVSHKYSLTVARHGTVVVAVPSTVHYPGNYKIKHYLRWNLKVWLNSSH